MIDFLRYHAYILLLDRVDFLDLGEFALQYEYLVNALVNRLDIIFRRLKVTAFHRKRLFEDLLPSFVHVVVFC